MSKLDEFKAAHAEYRKKIAEEGRAAIAEAFSEVFAAHPEVKAIGWTQYTPHFNDGDACVFRVGDIHYTVKDVKPEEVRHVYEDETWDYCSSRTPVGQAVRELGDKLPEDVMLVTFGDHALVVATPAGFHVTAYSHD